MAKATRMVKKKSALGQISKKSNFACVADFFVHFFAVFLHDYNVNFHKLPSYKFYGGNVVHLVPFCSLPLIFTLVATSISHFLTPLQNFHVVLPTKNVSFNCFTSLAVALCRSFSR